MPSNIVTYCFTRIPFDSTSSLFLLKATIKHHLEKTNAMNKDNLSTDIHVDNLIMGADNKEDASQIYQSSKKKFKEILMNLREWKTSSSDVNKSFKDDQMKG